MCLCTFKIQRSGAHFTKLCKVKFYPSLITDNKKVAVDIRNYIMCCIWQRMQFWLYKQFPGNFEAVSLTYLLDEAYAIPPKVWFGINNQYRNSFMMKKERPIS